jgi:hypothetical protein
MTRDREAKFELFQAVERHKLDLEFERGVISGPDLEVLDRRVEAVQQLLEWLSRALGPDPPSFPAVQTLWSSSPQADQHQTPPSAPDPPKPRR